MTDPTDPKDPLDPEAAWRAAVLAALGPDERELEDEKARDAVGAMLTDGGRKPIMDDAGVDAARKDIKK